MAKQPLITTIIPTFNRSRLLKKTVDSVLNQTFPGFIVKVFDNHSNDNTPQVIQEMAKRDSRIHYWRHPQTISAVENFQFGISQVTTPFFSILADDDRLSPRFYEWAVESLDKYPSAQFFLGSIRDVNETGKVISVNAKAWKKQEYYEPFEGVLPIIEHYFNWMGGVFRTQTIREIRLDSRIVAFDFDFILRLAVQHPYVFSKKPCGYFVHHPESFSGRCGLKIVWPGYLHIAENLCKKIPQPAQKKALDALMRNFQSKLFRIAVTEFINRNASEVDRVFVLAQQTAVYGRKLRFLHKVIAIAQKISFGRSLFAMLFWLRRQWKAWISC